MLQKETTSAIIIYDTARDFLKVVSKDVKEITLAEARSDFQLAAEMVSFRKTPVLADSRNYTQFTQEIRDFYAGREIAERISVMAILVTSLATRIMGNFFINFHKPHFPTRLFTDEDAAVAWLLEKNREHKALSSAKSEMS